MEVFKIMGFMYLQTFLCYLSCAQNSGGFDLYLRLESQLNTFNSSLIRQQRQIDIILGDLLIQQIGHEDDVQRLTTQLRTTGEKLSLLEKAVKENSNAIASNSIQLVSTELEILELATTMDRLNATNQLWRSNFQVVNRTFAELRKKLVFVVPVIRGSGRNSVI